MVVDGTQGRTDISGRYPVRSSVHRNISISLSPGDDIPWASPLIGDKVSWHYFGFW